jgi:hypothetical protein
VVALNVHCELKVRRATRASSEQSSRCCRPGRQPKLGKGWVSKFCNVLILLKFLLNLAEMGNMFIFI